MWVRLIVLCVLFIYGYFKWIYLYWARKGFKHLEPTMLVGNMGEFAKGEKSYNMAIWSLYQKTTKSFIGLYVFTQPSLLIRDVDLVKRILVIDFDHFYDRGIYINEKRDPMSANLLSQTGIKWKRLRQKLSPLFSVVKLKNMFPTILQQVDNLDNFLDSKAENHEIINIKDTLISYVLSTIGSIFFGYDLDLINEPDHIFRKMHGKITHSGLINKARLFLSFMAPKLMNMLRIPRYAKEVRSFFMQVVETTVHDREKNNITRNDFTQVLIHLMKDEQNENPDGNDNFTIEEIAGNSFIFYIAGTETTSTTASHCIYELALQPELLTLVQIEIDEILSKYEGQLSFDSLQEMVYLEMCIKETLRKYPGLPVLNRICTKDYKIPNTELTIKKGTSIVISTMGLHYDPQYFENPTLFDPERFRAGKERYNKDAYIPFGEGQKQCIAVRMGIMNAKAAIAKLLSKYNFKSADDKPIEFDTHSVGPAAKGGLPLIISKRIENY